MEPVQYLQFSEWQNELLETEEEADAGRGVRSAGRIALADLSRQVLEAPAVRADRGQAGQKAVFPGRHADQTQAQRRPRLQVDGALGLLNEKSLGSRGLFFAGKA